MNLNFNVLEVANESGIEHSYSYRNKKVFEIFAKAIIDEYKNSIEPVACVGELIEHKRVELMRKGCDITTELYVL